LSNNGVFNFRKKKMADTDASAEWHRVASVGEVEEDEPKPVRIGETLIALYNIQGKFYATADVCPHEFALLSDGYVEGDTVECPLHQARFHIPTGKVLDPPAEDNVATFSVKVEGDDILVGIPKS